MKPKAAPAVSGKKSGMTLSQMKKHVGSKEEKQEKALGFKKGGKVKGC